MAGWIHSLLQRRRRAERGFVRILPKLLLKFARIPALFGGATIAGLAYVQYQAARMPSVEWIIGHGC